MAMGIDKKTRLTIWLAVFPPI